MPKWTMDAYPMGPLFGIPTENGSADIAANSGYPIFDTIKAASDPLAFFKQNLSPEIKIPAELITRRKFDSGAPITDMTDYAVNQTPVVGRVNRILTGGSAGQTEGRAPNWLPALNEVTGAGLSENNKPSYQAQAELDEIRRKAKAKKEAERG